MGGGGGGGGKARSEAAEIDGDGWMAEGGGGPLEVAHVPAAARGEDGNPHEDSSAGGEEKLNPSWWRPAREEWLVRAQGRTRQHDSENQEARRRPSARHP